MIMIAVAAVAQTHCGPTAGLGWGQLKDYELPTSKPL
jgi:hypothetical protein